MPQAFRWTYPYVVSLEGRTYRLRAGDPQGTVDRVAYVLDVYAASRTTVRIVEAA
jgi:hypothetical protein